MGENQAAYSTMGDVRWGERDPQTGGEVFGGFALWEVPGVEKRRFRVTAWEQTCVLNYRDRKGWILLARGFVGEDSDPRPLFAEAAKNFPERAAEFQEQIRLTTQNMNDRLAEIARKPPTRSEVEQLKDERLGRVVGQSMAETLGRVLGAAKEKRAQREPDAMQAEPESEAEK